MNPVIRRLKNTLFAEYALGLDDADVLHWTFSERINALGPDFYRKIIPSHLILNLEYSLLGQQIRNNLSGVPLIQEEQIVEQLVAAIFLAELLEHVYQQYLLVPREVKRFQEEQRFYREILEEIKQVPLPLKYSGQDNEVDVGISFSHQLRQRTIHINLYRLFFLRSKRALDLIAVLDGSADWYCYVIGTLDRYTDPLIPHLGFLFYVPRLVINLSLLAKHVVPGLGMEHAESELGWFVQLQGQLLRRWFELANDLVWVTIGFMNAYVLTGALTPIGIYLAIVFFGYDVAVSLGRTYIELTRLYTLRQDYLAMMNHGENTDAIEQHLSALYKQINFEKLRLWSHVATTTGIFFATFCSAPLFAAHPVVALVGALTLVLICFVNFALVPILDYYRPKDNVEIPVGGITKLGFFAKKNDTLSSRLEQKDNAIRENDLESSQLSFF